MANESRKTSELPLANSAQLADRVLILKDPTGNTSTRTISVLDLFGNTAANVVLQSNTPANSSITIKKGTIFFDSTYLYIATDNNLLQRITLNAF